MKKRKKIQIPENLTPEQELFCQFYVNNPTTRFNATQSYLAAYELDEGKQYDSAKALASRLFTSVNIKARVNELIDADMSDEFVDRELHSIIAQNDDRNPKIQAIREYNKLKGRITEHHEIEATASLSELLKAGKPG